MGAKQKSQRKQINIRLEEELHDFLMRHAQKNYKSVTAVVREMIVQLWRKEENRKEEDDKASDTW